MKYNKLVRDKIPDIIEKSGQKPIFHTVDKALLPLCLRMKLNEEVLEYNESECIEELADILEVVYALCEASGNSIKRLHKLYRQKHKERGGFSKGIFLKEVVTNAHN